MKHETLTKGIIGTAMTVLNELRPGLDEKLYENALLIELSERVNVCRSDIREGGFVLEK